MTIMNNLEIFWKKHGATVLSVLGCAGVVGTAVSAVRDHEKYKKDISENKLHKLVNYAPTALVGTATVACILGSNGMNKNVQAGMISAYGLLNESYSDYKRKLIEFHGPEEHKRIMDSIAVEKAETPHIYADALLTATSLNSDDITSAEQKRLFYDAFSKRYFESTYGNVLQAQYHLNRNFCLAGMIMLNDYYELLGLEQTIEGNELAWYIGNGWGYAWIDFNNEVCHLEDGTEYIRIEMPFEPTLEWQDEWA